MPCAALLCCVIARNVVLQTGLSAVQDVCRSGSGRHGCLQVVAGGDMHVNGSQACGRAEYVSDRRDCVWSNGL